jgi:DNA-binding transcriptional MerR regulator
MKISELIKRTNVSKETIHYYIREGALPKPQKRGKNTADYNEEIIDLLQLIKDLQDQYFLPLSEIKKIIKKQKNHAPIDKINLKFLTRNLRPIDQMSLEMISGRENFIKKTGMGEKYLMLMEEWGIINPEVKDGVLIYSPDNVIIGKLIVDMDRLGFVPEDLKCYNDLLKSDILPAYMNLLKDQLFLLTYPEFKEKSIKLVEVATLFSYHLTRKVIREEVARIINQGTIGTALLKKDKGKIDAALTKKKKR